VCICEWVLFRAVEPFIFSINVVIFAPPCSYRIKYVCGKIYESLSSRQIKGTVNSEIGCYYSAQKNTCQQLFRPFSCAGLRLKQFDVNNYLCRYTCICVHSPSCTCTQGAPWSNVPRVEAGSNTSTVTLRVVGGDENGSLKCETVKYGPETQGARTKERLRWQGPAAYIKIRPVLSSERAPHKIKTVIVIRVIKIWS
jgi:hypothetical protein